jgi:hypothetical protein
MNLEFEKQLQLSRRQFFGKAASGVGVAALAGLLADDGLAQARPASGMPPLPGLPHHKPTAKRVIVLWQGGAPSHVDLFDYKPGLERLRGQQVPDSIRSKARLSTMTATQKNYPVLPPQKPFRQYGKSGMWLSEMLPHTGSIADEICLVKSMHTEAVNHAPGVTLFMTGSQVPGRPSMGAWATYGLGSMTNDLPSFVVMTSMDRGRTCGQLFYDYYWGSGFLPSKYQGVRFRGEGDPILYLPNPDGMTREHRRGVLSDIAELNRKRLADYGDPEIETRIVQYELAYRMQTSVPELLDVSQEPRHILDLYGPDVERSGSYARNCLLARRLIERGVRFVQLMHSGWDQHSNWSTQLEVQCRSCTRAGTSTATGARSWKYSAETRTSRRRRSSATFSSAGCWRTRSSSGHPSSGARRSCRATLRSRAAMGAITWAPPTVCGWRVAASTAARSSARPTTIVITWRRIRSTVTTFRPRSSMRWASTIRGSPIAIKGGSSG